MPETGHKELTSEKPPGLEQWVKGEHEKEDEEQRRAQEAREEKRRAQEAHEEQRRAQKALEQRKAQEEQEREAKKAQEERERQAKEDKTHEEQEWQVRETEAREEQREQERKIEAQECTKKEKEQREKGALKKKEKKRIRCRIDTWRGGKSLGGSVSTMDRTCGRREAVDECGVQPPEPRERCALLKKPSVNLERQKERDRGDGEEKKATRCTSCCTYPPTKLHQPNNSSNSSRSTQQLHSETGSLRRSERVTFALAPLLRKQRTTS